MASPSLISTAINVLAAPKDAFAAIRERPVPAFPLFIVLAGLVAVTAIYMNAVDLQWLIESQLRASAATATMTDADIQRAATAASQSPAFLATVSSVSAAIVVTVIFVVFALYLWGVSSIGHHGIRFIQAFALVCWSSLPGLLTSVATIMNVLVTDATFMPAYERDPLSFGVLLGIEPATGSAAQQTLLGLDPIAFWTAGLMVVGYKSWSGKSLPVAAAIVLAPYVVLLAASVASFL